MWKLWALCVSFLFGLIFTPLCVVLVLPGNKKLPKMAYQLVQVVIILGWVTQVLWAFIALLSTEMPSL
jgi:hypothetical protein